MNSVLLLPFRRPNTQHTHMHTEENGARAPDMHSHTRAHRAHVHISPTENGEEKR